MGHRAAFCFPLYRAANAGTGEVPLAFAFVLAATAFLDVMEHSLLSGEQLPARWSARGYLRADRFLREWWWLAAAGLFGAAAAFGGAGSGEFRFVPLLLLVACIAQGIVFGADPRLSLPFVPLVALSLAASRPGRFTAGRTAAGLLAAAMLLSAAVAVPDTANSDFAVLRGPGRRLEQVIAASRFPASETATLHLRLVKPDGIGLGLTIKGNGEPLYERAPEDVSATPAFLSLVLRGPALARAATRLEARGRYFRDLASSGHLLLFPRDSPGLPSRLSHGRQRRSPLRLRRDDAGLGPRLDPSRPGLGPSNE